MKRILLVVAVVLLLCGCKLENTAYERMMEFRNRLQSSAGCTFITDITADYGENVYTFTLDCKSDNYGNVRFVVESPESIAGISGEISQNGGKLTFDDKALAFELLADGCASPVSAPWFIMRALLGGYISSCASNKDGLTIQIDDSYGENPLKLEMWTDQQLNPNRADILWQGRRIMSVEIEDFLFTEDH